MIIKLTGVSQVHKNGYDFKVIEGVKEYDGKEYTKEFFANNKTLNAQLEQFKIGDRLKLEFKNDQFKNLAGISAAGEAAARPSGGGGRQSVRRADGGSRGDDTNRSAAIYLAKDIVRYNNADGLVDPHALFEMADMVFQYIKNGTMPSFGDPLEPPEVE